MILYTLSFYSRGLRF